MIGDLHFGHKRIADFRGRGGFADETEHSDYICEKWKHRITKHDLVFVLGDAAFNVEGLERFATLPGRKILIIGNHDQLSTNRYLEFFEKVHGFWQYKKAWLSHVPIHPGELRGRVNIHGHSHCDHWGKGYINVCAEHVEYTPQNYQSLLKGELNEEIVV